MVAMPLATSTATFRRGSRRRKEGQHVLRGRRRGCRDARWAPAAPAEGTVRSRTSVSSSPMPVSLDTGIASRRENFSPLYFAGLWLAVTWMPADAARWPIAK